MVQFWAEISIPSVFLAHDGPQQFFNSSTYNDEEINIGCRVIQEIRRRVQQAKIVVLTPYRAQVKFFTRKLRDPSVRVCTVHAFQVKYSKIFMFYLS